MKISVTLENYGYTEHAAAWRYGQQTDADARGWEANTRRAWKERDEARELAAFAGVALNDALAVRNELAAELQTVTDLCYDLAMKAPTLEPRVDYVIPRARAAIARAITGEKGGSAQ